MYNYVWFAAGTSGILLLSFLVLLIKDLSYCERTKKTKWRYLLPNWALFLVTVAWGVLAIALYLNIQQQLTS
ncbi:hypothetical protein IGI39_004561 [Enterococcus sp. AZ135]|uniref:hypothetical protein n=1 Tax=unclassified Enterococcus TaxID=2608891 RepID=UPI003F2795D9